MYQKFKIGSRLFISFAVTLAFMLAISVMGSLSIWKESKASEQMYHSDLLGISALSSYQYSFMTMRLSSYKVTYAGAIPPEQQGAELQKIADENFKAMDGYLQAFKDSARTAAAQKEYETLAGLTEQYKTANQATMDAQKGATRDMDKVNELVKANAAVATQLNDKLNETIAADKQAAEAASAANDRTAVLSLVATLVLAVLGLLASVALGLIVTKTITRPIARLVVGANKLAAGDLDMQLETDRNDEVGVLARAVQGAVDSVRRLVADANTLSEAAVEGRLNARADAGAHQGEYRRVIEGVNATLDAVITPIHECVAVMGRIANNDYTVGVTGSYRGVPLELANAVNETRERILTIQTLFDEMAVGDTSMLAALQKMGKRSENDRLIPAGILMLEKLDELVDVVNRLSALAAQGDLEQRGDLKPFDGKYRQAVAGINAMLDAISAPLDDAAAALEAMAGNDYTRGMSEEYNGEFRRLAESVNRVEGTLNGVLGELSSAAEQVASGTQQVSEGSQSLSQGATEQASAIEQLTASIAQIAGQTRDNAVNADRANNLAVQAHDSAAAGDARMKQMQQSMVEINDASANISKIIKVIDDIAFQTNLLALNAAVEAARAGQHGKGFAVVAEEVRNLAARSANAAKETTEMIEGSIRKVADGTHIADETAQALAAIVDDVDKAAGLISGIASASNEQATAVAQVNRGIEQVSQVVQTNSATAEESAATAEELSGQAEMLQEMVRRFRLKNQRTEQPARAAKSLPAAPGASVKPRIALSSGEFGKY